MLSSFWHPFYVLSKFPEFLSSNYDSIAEQVPLLKSVELPMSHLALPNPPTTTYLLWPHYHHRKTLLIAHRFLPDAFLVAYSEDSGLLFGRLV